MTDAKVAAYSPEDCGDFIRPRYEPMPASVLAGSIIDRFEEIVCRHSARPAVSDARCDLSYAELAHIVEPNHTPAFWIRVERAMPTFQLAKHQLARIGSGLWLGEVRDQPAHPPH